MPDNNGKKSDIRMQKDNHQVTIETLLERLAACEESITRLKKAAEEGDWILEGEQATRAGFEKANLSFDLILESITDGFLAVDTDWRITHINEKAALVLNRPKSKVFGSSVWAELPQSISETLHDPAHQTVSDKEPTSIEVYFPTRGRWYDYRLFPSQEGLYMFFHDITDQKKAEEEQGLLAAIVNYSEDAIMAVTTDGIVTYWSPGAERLYGYRSDEVVGQSISLIIPPELAHEAQLFMDLLKEVEKDQGTVNFETERVARDGTKFNISVRFSPIRDAEGNDIGISVVHRDITERKRMEEALGTLQKKPAS